ncbi:MFS transporter [bacterium 1xD8-48]|nr:MFS transporter [bacterium 1xD8-48]
MNKKLFTRDFTLVVIGQIISLFGNATIRFALPLYLMNLTGSAALFGTVTACAFIPSVLVSPVGGIIADRINKRNIMVALDFFTAAVILLFSLLKNDTNVVVLLTVTLMLLYGIAGAYQPSVQASIPSLVNQENYVAANSVVNVINSLSALTGPALGGVLYSAYGLEPVLWVCIICFFVSAVMEIFIRMPFQKQPSGGGIWKTVKGDFRESFRFIIKEEPAVCRGLLAVCGINLFLSAMINVGMPYLITEVMDLGAFNPNQLYGFAEGTLAAGGLAGGICVGVLAGKLVIQKAGNLLILASLCVFPMGISFLLFRTGMINYLVMVVCCFAIMIFSTIFSVQAMSFVQARTPQALIGKVIAVMLTISMCAHPLGSMLYGFLFEAAEGKEFAVVLFAGAVSFLIAVKTKKIFKEFA